MKKLIPIYILIVLLFAFMYCQSKCISKNISEISDLQMDVLKLRHGVLSLRDVVESHKLRFCPHKNKEYLSGCEYAPNLGYSRMYYEKCTTCGKHTRKTSDEIEWLKWKKENIENEIENLLNKKGNDE